MILRLDLVLLTPAWCSHCGVDFESGDLVASSPIVGNVFLCLSCAHGMLEAERDAWEPAHEHADAETSRDLHAGNRENALSVTPHARIGITPPAREREEVGTTPELLGRILQRTSVGLLLDAHHGLVDHAYSELVHDPNPPHPSGALPRSGPRLSNEGVSPGRRPPTEDPSAGAPQTFGGLAAES